MSIREANFLFDTMHGIAHQLGIDPELDILPDHARAWANSVNNKVRYALDFWPWPELEVTEERAFRQVWFDDVSYQPGRGEDSEVYYPVTEKYYRLVQEVSAGETPAATPGESSAWEEIPLAQLQKYIAYRQYGKRAIDHFVECRMTNDECRRGEGLALHTSPSGYGIDVPSCAGPTVWVTFVPRPPKFSDEAYRSNKTYRRGEVALNLTTGHCWRALRPSTGAHLQDGDYWTRQIMPYVIADYVKYSAAAENVRDAQTKAILEEQGQQSLKGEVDKLIAQGQLNFYGRRVMIPPKPFGVTWDYYRAYWRSYATA